MIMAGQKRKRIAEGGGLALNRFIRPNMTLKQIIKSMLQRRRKKRKKGGRFSVLGRHGATSGRGVNLGLRTGRGLNPTGGSGPGFPGGFGLGAGLHATGEGTFFQGNVSNSRSGQDRRIRTLLPPPTSSGKGLRRAGEGLRRTGEGLRRAGEGSHLSTSEKNILRAVV